MELYEAMQKRRTIRDFCQDRDVSDEQLERILNTAFLAPSNDHLRQIEFVVVRGREEIQNVIAPVEQNTNTIQAAGLASAEGVMDEDEYQMFSDALPRQKRMLMDSNLLILPFFRNPGIDLCHAGEQTMLNYFASVWCSIENILLAATNEGLGCVFRIPINDEIAHVKKTVGCPDGWDFACFLSIGYKAPDAKMPRQKVIDIKERIHMGKFSTSNKVKNTFVSVKKEAE